jgi:hypothetical protein
MVGFAPKGRKSLQMAFKETRHDVQRASSGEDLVMGILTMGMSAALGTSGDVTGHEVTVRDTDTGRTGSGSGSTYQQASENARADLPK